MIAEFDKWYPCEEGKMPEDFENVISKESSHHTKSLIVKEADGSTREDVRVMQQLGYLDHTLTWAWWKYPYNKTRIKEWKLPFGNDKEESEDE